MYDRAPRVLVATAPTSSTSENLGPGFYWQDGKDIKNGFAPFLSLSKRDSFLTISDQVAVAPGPGQYSLQESAPDKIRGGSTLQNKSTRFGSSSSDAPGPGSYSIKSSFSKKSLEQSNGFKTGMKNKCGRVIYTRQKTAPSIPFPGLSYGYEEDDYGQLVPKDLPERDTTIGPTYYNIVHNDTAVSEKYKGIHFSKLKSKRSLFKGKEGPGPAEYNPRKTSEGKSIAIQKSSAVLPRYHQLVSQMEEKKGVPGPGKYQIPSQFSDIQLSVSAEGVSQQPPFGCSQQRFSVTYPQSPASTKYSHPTSGFESLKRISGLTKSPFSQTAARFKADRKAREIPGPGSYNDDKVTSLSSESNKKANASAMKQNAFGSTGVRTAPMTKKDDYYIPGPATYQEPLQSDMKQEKGTSAFKSTTQRLYSPPSIVTSIPPPGSYEVLESYSKTQGHIDAKKSTLNNSAFMSSNSRFAPPRDIQLQETDAFNPGPAEYDPGTKLRIGNKQHGLICSKGDRFKAAQLSKLGPGTYQFSKSHNDTILKGTFNTTLNNPLSVEEDGDHQIPATAQGTLNSGHAIIITI